MNVIEEIKLELREMRKLDIFVPAEAFLIAEDEGEELDRTSGMSVSEMADYCILSARSHDLGLEVDSL